MGKVIVCRMKNMLKNEDWRGTFCELAAQIKTGVLVLPYNVELLGTFEADRIAEERELKWVPANKEGQK